MPISIALPPASLEYLLYMWYPSLETRDLGANIGNVAISSQRPQPWQGNVAIPPAFGAAFAVGTGGVVQQFRLFKGRPVAEWSMTLADNPNGQGWVMGHWMPSYGPAAGMNPGAFSANEAALVAVIDWHVALESDVDDMGTDRCGFMFLPAGGLADIRDTPGNPAGATVGGFGVFVNGAAPSTLEYVSWSLGNPAPILQRQTLSAQVPDMEDFSTVRFIIVGATPTSEAILSVRCNDTPVPNLTGVEFGSALLERPATAEPGGLSNAYGFAVAINDDLGSSNNMNFQVGAKWGRFTPDGAAQQGI